MDMNVLCKWKTISMQVVFFLITRTEKQGEQLGENKFS